MGRVDMRSPSFWFLLLGVIVPGAVFGLFLYFKVNIFLVILLLTYVLTVLFTFMPRRTGSS